jgi:RTX calcium-binding nonapeptide repeat (4 copies)
MALKTRFLILVVALVAGAVCATTAGATADHSDWPSIPIHDHTRYMRNDPPGIDNWVAIGTNLSDELLGGHHSDKLYGRGGIDILWGDYLAAGNTSHQRDRIYGGDGGDFIYGSHGRSVVYAGAGDDMIRIWFGRGYVDCGPGRDILYVSRKRNRKVKRRNCEKISHLSDRQVHGG